MTKLFYILAFFIGVFFFNSCEKINKPLNEEDANEPIYLLTGIVNGDSLKLFVDDTTVLIDNAPYDMNGVPAYSSTISDLESGFNLKMVMMRPEIYIDEAGVKLIKNGSLDYVVHENICNNFTFTQNPSQADYLSVTYNSETQTGGQINFEEYGIYQAKLNFSNLGASSYSLPLNIGFKDEILNPYFEVSNYLSTIQFSANNQNLIHQWSIDNLSVNSSSLFTDSSLTNGVHKITHSVTDEYGNIAEHSTLIYVNSSSLIWALSNSYCTPNIDINNYGNVIIEATHQGVSYTSVYNLANKNKTLEVSEIEYVIDADSQVIKFMKFKIKFDAELKSKDNTKTLNLKNMEGTFHIEIN